MLDFIGTILITAVTVVNINVVVSSLPVTRSRRLAAAVAVGLWIGLAAASATAGLLTVSRPFPYIGLFVATPLVAAAALVTLSPAWRSALLALPTPLLVGLNANRVFGALFLLLAAEGRLSGPFPYSAGWGDVITGALAIPVLWLVLRRPQGGYSLLTAWNAFGTLDLVVAIALGVTSVEGSPLHIFDVGAGAAAMQMLPWSFVPTVLVPFYLVLHGILFAQLRYGAKADQHPAHLQPESRCGHAGAVTA
jgi:hypothetical protein